MTAMHEEPKESVVSYLSIYMRSYLSIYMRLCSTPFDDSQDESQEMLDLAVPAPRTTMNSSAGAFLVRVFHSCR